MPCHLYIIFLLKVLEWAHTLMDERTVDVHLYGKYGDQMSFFLFQIGRYKINKIRPHEF